MLVNLKTKSYHIDVEEGPLVTSLSLRARQLQNDVDNLLRRTGLVHIDSFFSWSQRKPDGSQFESTYCLSIPFSFELTRRAFDAQTPCTAEKNDMIKLKVLTAILVWRSDVSLTSLLAFCLAVRR